MEGFIAPVSQRPSQSESCCRQVKECSLPVSRQGQYNNGFKHFFVSSSFLKYLKSPNKGLFWCCMHTQPTLTATACVVKSSHLTACIGSRTLLLWDVSLVWPHHLRPAHKLSGKVGDKGGPQWLGLQATGASTTQRGNGGATGWLARLREGRGLGVSQQVGR